ncbi:MAG: hypothetical protein M1830_000967 [Pleopsidium flavum]|nr:MAG: hypothetical protein M1830_000967 [Pleopsidium flavum]
MATMGYSANGTMQAQTAPGRIQYRAPSHNFQHVPQTAQHDNGNVHMANLTQTFGGVNLNGLQSVNSGRVSGSSMPGHSAGLTHLVGAQSSDPIYLLPDGRLMVAGIQSTQPTFQQAPAAFKSAATQYLPQMSFQSYLPGQPMISALPQPHTWSSQPMAKEVPDLAEPRRTSWSSNEENAPRTPFFGAVSQTDYQPGIAVTDRSLSNGFAYSTPSTQQMSQPYLPLQIGKGLDGHYTYLDLDALTQQEPAIPSAVPAPWSSNSQRTLDKALRNEFGITNVYIRGLLPDTTDDIFGFVNFHNYIQCENCIRGFFHLGYEVSFARESHNSRLKTLSDPSNTNLYVSNLPRDIIDADLKKMFPGYAVVSAKILRDSNGINRGVGFARMETHEICEDIIAKYHGQPFGEEGTKLQIRYADTDEQKKLKNLTTERRQFKTHEYNAVVFGGTSPYQYPSPTSDGFPTNFTSHVQGAPGAWMTQPSVSPSTASQSPSIVNGVQPNLAVPGYVVPVHGRYSPRNSYIADSPSVTAVNKRAVQEKSTPGSVASTPERKNSAGNMAPMITLHDDVSSPSTSSA